MSWETKKKKRKEKEKQKTKCSGLAILIARQNADLTSVA